MKTQEILDPQAWAEITFGQAQLQDMRRTRRAVLAAAQMASDPAASLPAHTHTWKDTKAVYRLLDEPDVTFDALIRPHWQQTRERMDSLPLVLLVQDTTDLDFAHRRKMSGLGEIGDGNGRGWYLQTVLAVEPGSREVLGCASQHPFIRIPAPTGETRTQRRVQPADERIAHLFEQARGVPAQDQRPFDLPAGHGRKARATTLHLSWILLTSLEVTSCQDAWQRVEWYRARLRGRGVSPLPENRRSHPGASGAKRRSLDPLVGHALCPRRAVVAGA
jgi:Transposase DNA-binding